MTAWLLDSFQCLGGFLDQEAVENSRWCVVLGEDTWVVSLSPRWQATLSKLDQLLSFGFLIYKIRELNKLNSKVLQFQILLVFKETIDSFKSLAGQLVLPCSSVVDETMLAFKRFLIVP